MISFGKQSESLDNCKSIFVIQQDFLKSSFFILVVSIYSYTNILTFTAAHPYSVHPVQNSVTIPVVISQNVTNKSFLVCVLWLPSNS